MKNTTIITVAALLAAGTAFANAETQDVDFSSTGTTYKQAGFRGFDFSLSLAKGNWLSLPESSGIIELPSTLTLNSISLYGANTWYKMNNSNGLGIAIYSKGAAEDSSTLWTFVGGSDWKTDGNVSNTTSSVNSPTTFTFGTNGLTLEKNTLYTAVFYAGQAAFNNLTTSSTLTSSTFVGNEYKNTTDFSSATIATVGLIYNEKTSGGVLYKGTNEALGTGTPKASFNVTIPEPSAFGLLAGLGALALAGTRRRRRK
ncbi:PEP-CTERM sorting domain-containing protein [Candidatus Spyradosoma sp. SGI.093]|uniref:PEP-CTERM sorting domain-containing protein n=1 Tax=Candidatus Spyradosoma sp. SGI.093 TaxID=3420583 RepID=UPI003D060A36